MAEYSWPARDKAQVIGTRVDRLDGLEKATGAAKYTYDINLKKQLIAKALSCPLAHCEIKSIDTSPAEKIPGVVHVHVFEHAQPGSEIQWEGELLAVVAAESEGAAAEGVKAIKIDLEKLDVWTDDEDLAGAEAAGRTAKAGGKAVTQKEPGDDDDEDEFVEAEIARLLKESKHVVEGYYGINAITHCCLEPHGSTVEWQGDKLKAYLSTQNVSGTDDSFARDLKITADDVEVVCQYIGGGFGSKFAPDYWGTAAAKISKATGRPVKFMLDRAQELKDAGNRPSGFLKVKLGADADGVVQVWDSLHWGTSGYKGGGVSHGVIPYVFEPPNYRRKATGIKTNTVTARAWRAPNHPQACAISQTAYDDLARVMGVDSYDIFWKNVANVSNDKTDVYRAEMEIGAELIGWKHNWHPHGKGPKKGSIVEGLGMALHTWGGVANTSNCNLRVYPDGGVETFCGTQDLGTGTRTVCAMVVAETFGLKPTDIKVNIGTSKYPVSGASGGSTTVGAVSESHRRASQDAIRAIFKLVAPELKCAPEELEAVAGRIQKQGDAGTSVSWKEACTKIGLKPLEITGSHQRGTPSPLSNQGVGGVQMAHVAVDTETGVVKMKKFVAVQDQGLVINPKTCESQIYGAVIMGIATALYEERIMDNMTGAFINAELADYHLPKLGDIGEIVIRLYEPDSERERGVIGNGEPPVISPGAAISNAVCNALGVRVPVLPMTSKRVLDALKGESITMKNFEYAAPRTEAEVLELLSDEPGKSELLAGGTDLIGLMKKMVVTPDRVVNIMEVPSLQQIEPLSDGGLSIGATVTLDDLLASPYLEDYPAIAQAINGINSMQLQAQGTLGGEICQRARCWYFRNGHGLLAHGGRISSGGDNRYHAIFGNSGPAKFVNGSRLAPALIVLGARARVLSADGETEKWIAVEDFFRTPRHEGQRETVLEPPELLTHIVLPPAKSLHNATYEVRQGEGPEYPLAAAAASLKMDLGIVREAKVVLGQVAPIPWVSQDAANQLLGLQINDAVAEAAGDAAVATATPLSDNQYKVDLARVAIKRAILRAAGLETGGF